MKKTILSIAAACLLTITGAKAEESSTQIDASFFTAQTNVEVSSFCKAIMKGDLVMVKKFIALGENLEKKSMGLTPVMFAARYNKAKILKLLIENGASLTVKSDKGYSAKKYAELSNAMEALAVIKAAKGI